MSRLPKLAWWAPATGEKVHAESKEADHGILKIVGPEVTEDVVLLVSKK